MFWQRCQVSCRAGLWAWSCRRLTLVRKLKVWATSYFTLRDVSSVPPMPSAPLSFLTPGHSPNTHTHLHRHTNKQSPKQLPPNMAAGKKKEMTVEERSKRTSSLYLGCLSSFGVLPALPDRLLSRLISRISISSAPPLHHDWPSRCGHLLHSEAHL